MSTVPHPASPCTTDRLPSRVEVRGKLYYLVLVPGRMYDGRGVEKHYVADHEVGVLRLSGAIPVNDRRHVLARALIDLNSPEPTRAPLPSGFVEGVCVCGSAMVIPAGDVAQCRECAAV